MSARATATTIGESKTFVDTNVFVYAIDGSETRKRDVARRVLASSEYGRFVVSAQVMGEFYVTVTRKLAERLSEEEAVNGLSRLENYPTVSVDTALVKDAIETSRTNQISYWDGLIVAAATRAGCERLLTEDLNDGQQIGSVHVENPFRDTG
jgi:predicted nucleic acid-binding protein